MGLFPTTGKDFVSGMGIISEQIKDAKLELRVAEQTKEGIRNQLKEQMDGRTAALVAHPEYAPKIAVPELDGRIDALKRQIDEALRNYTEQHPDIVGNRRLLARLEEERNREVEARRKSAAGRPPELPSGDPVVEQLKVALNEAEANVTTVRAKVAEFESRYLQYKAAAESLPRIDSEFTQLNRDYDIQRSQYSALVSRRETASMTGKLEDAGIAEFRIIDPPRVTPTPVAPNRMALLWGLIAGSLAAGLATAFAVSMIRPTFHDGRVLREIAGRPLLGMVSMIAGPEYRSKRRRSALMFMGGMSGLMASYAVAFTITYLAAGRL